MPEEIIPSPESTEQTIVPAQYPVVLKEGGNFAVTALVPDDMTICHSALIQWCEHKIAEVKTDAQELRGALEHARAQKWKTSTYERHAIKAEKKVSFYEKVLAALRAGFVIVPNFPVQVFALRTDKERPLRLMRECSWRPELKQEAMGIEAGEGEYKNPFPLVDWTRYAQPTPQDQNKMVTKYWAAGWDEFEFPLSMSKPEIMEATTRAMALKIFDEIGILPAHRKEDPIIIGQIILRGGSGWNDKTVSFMIAWHLDTRTL